MSRSACVQAGRNVAHIPPAKLEAFVAVAEERGFSRAARRLHISQPALSQTINAIERQIGVPLLVRCSSGVHVTEPGQTLLAQARVVLAHHDRLLKTMAAFDDCGAGVIRLGVPLEMSLDVLTVAIVKLAEGCPTTRVRPDHQCTAAQLAALRSGELDVALLRERPTGPDMDASLIVREPLGVLLSSGLTAELAGPVGIRLQDLSGLEWVGFRRVESPLWYDELAATLRSHGIEIGVPATHELTIAVKAAAVSSARAFAFAPPYLAAAVPDTIVWSPLAGDPVVRRTWVVWPATSRRRDIACLIDAFEQIAGTNNENHESADGADDLRTA